jgi:hypothetical protein
MAQYYRNKEEHNGVEPESLWKLIDDHFVLVDDDQYIVAGQDQASEFYEVSDPFPDVT